MTDNSGLWAVDGTLPVPSHQNVTTVKLWTDYAIWGLDIYDNQPVWFSLIELVLILTDRHRKNETRLLADMPSAPDGTPLHEDVRYDLYFHHNLRHLLFRDQDILPFSERNTTDQQSLWNEWFASVRRDFRDTRDFTYLRAAFGDDFNKFSEAVNLIRSAEVEPMHAKRWTSRHLLPLGDTSIFPDYAIKAGGKPDLDRRFFRRTGEIYYLMLSRASADLRERLEPLLRKRFFEETNPWNQIARKLQGDQPLADADKTTTSSFAYLPWPNLDRYDVLAGDFINVLGHGNIPLEDALDYLMRMAGLNEVVYIVERAAEVCGMDGPPPFYLDFIGTANHMRNASLEQYKVHKNLTVRAVESYIRSFFRTEEWTRLAEGNVQNAEAQRLVKERFLFQTRNSAAHPTSKSEQEKQLLAASKSRSHTISTAFTAHARQIGLLSLKQGRGGWYSPSDALLEALVVANVDGTMEFRQFLRRLYERYGFVVGDEEAKRVGNNRVVPGEVLVANEKRFEERLLVLGFIDRKSDQCAFVVNPFSAES